MSATPNLGFGCVLANPSLTGFSLRWFRLENEAAGTLGTCKVHVHLGFHFYWLTIHLKRIVLPCLHCVECSLSQHLLPEAYAKVLHVSEDRDCGYDHYAPFNMGLLRIRGILGIFPSGSVPSH